MNHVGKYIMVFESTTETRSTDQTPGELESSPIPVSQAAEDSELRPSQSLAQVEHALTQGLPTLCKSPKQETSNTNYTSHSHRALPHFDGDKWDMAFCTAHSSSYQQSSVETGDSQV